MAAASGLAAAARGDRRLPSDSEELRVRKAVLVLSSTLMASLAFVWVATYAALGLWVSAAIPFVYQVASATSIYTFARTRRYLLFRRSQLWMSLLLPFALQWSLGGFENVLGGVPVGVHVAARARCCSWGRVRRSLVRRPSRDSSPSRRAIDPALAADAPDIPSGVVVAFFALNILGVATTAYALLQYFVRARERALADLAREHRALELEQAKSERLLLNVLPEPVATRLKEHEGIIADASPSVTVLFADIVGFTPLVRAAVRRRMSWRCWTACSRAGTRSPPTTASRRSRRSETPTWSPAAFRCRGRTTPRRSPRWRSRWGPTFARCAAETGTALEVRIGIDTGPVVAGVIGRAKFIYDLWGDTVNTASRMESHAPPGTIQVTERAYERLRGLYEFRPRGTIEVKGKGPMRPYLLLGRRRDHQTSAVARFERCADDVTL